MAKKATVTMYRSAKTGKAVSKAYADSHPATTEKETYKKTAKKKKTTKKKAAKKK